MRIVGGDHRGRILVAPKGQSTRPTADRARQAMFDVLEHAPWSRPLSGARVLDLFSGSGALGMEALSRGAASCLFVDSEESALAAIRANRAALRLAGESAIAVRGDASRFAPPTGARFDLVFLDPPYGKNLIAPALANLLAREALAENALVVAERGPADRTPDPPGFTGLDERRWGVAQVSFLVKT